MRTQKIVLFRCGRDIVLFRCGRKYCPFSMRTRYIASLPAGDLRHRWWLFVGIEGLDCAGYFAVVECVGQGHFELLYR